MSSANAYLADLKQFTRWMYRSGRASEDPLRHLSRNNPAGKEVVKRRALTEPEIAALLETAYSSKSVRDGANGPTRELLYRMALETGLRFSELKTLKVYHLDPGGRPPTVTVEGGYSKSGRTDVLPLRKDLTEDLREHCSDRMPEASAFDMWKVAVGARMLKADLEEAGVPYKDTRGRKADFHALRHTFITNLARHSTMELTMQVYTLVALDTKEEAVNRLPAFPSRAGVINTG